jgi:hypothetical protein
MKLFNKSLIVLMMVGLFGLTACDEFLDVNTDPNNPTEVPVSLLMTSSQTYLAYTMGGDVNRYAGTFVQHFAGVQGQAQEEYDLYNFGDDETNNFWRFGMYAGALGDLDLIMKDASANGSPHYEGVAKIMMAYGIGAMTDLFGRVPFSEAFQFTDNTTPAYDNQEDIYNTIINDLTEQGIALCQESESVFSPGSDDLIYGGDLNKWIKFARFLQLRYHNHKSVQDAEGSANAILALLDDNDDEFTATGDAANFFFFLSPNSGHPLFQFEQQRGQIAVSDEVLDRMNALNDPRIPLYADSIPGGTYVGAPNGTTIQDQVHETFSGVGPFYESSNSPVPLGTYYEQKFIEAEAAMRLNQTGRAHQAYLAAIRANFDALGLDQAAYDAYVGQATVDPGEANLTMELLMTQKFLAMFTQGAESWTDWRRTGIPAITPSIGNILNDQIPVRFPYPESEFSFNAGNVPSTTLLDPVWFQDGTED